MSKPFRFAEFNISLTGSGGRTLKCLARSIRLYAILLFVYCLPLIPFERITQSKTNHMHSISTLWKSQNIPVLCQVIMTLKNSWRIFHFENACISNPTITCIPFFFWIKLIAFWVCFLCVCAKRRESLLTELCFFFEITTCIKRYFSWLYSSNRILWFVCYSINN